MWGLLILALPIVGVVLTILAYAVLVGFGVRGRTAEGEHRELAFSGCPEAAPVVADRLRDMGLVPTPVERTDGFAFDVVLPAEADVAARIPTTLAIPGRLEIRGDGEVLATSADVRASSVRMDLMMVPSTLVNLGPDAAERVTTWVRAHPEGKLEFWLDGVAIGTQSSQNPVGKGEVEIAPMRREVAGSPPEELDDRSRWLAVAEWSVVIDHPLPCAVTSGPGL